MRDGIIGLLGQELRNLAKAAIVGCLRLVEEAKAELEAGPQPAPAATSRRLPSPSKTVPARIPPQIEMAEQPQPPVRRRGRPRKQPAPTPASAAPAAAAEAPAQPARRRGRPRKQAATADGPIGTHGAAPAAQAARRSPAQPPTGEEPAHVPAGVRTGPEPMVRTAYPEPMGLQAEEAAPTRGHGAAGRLNLNTASRAELLRLPRVGTRTADQIIAFREQYGPIRGMRQLRQAEIVSVTAARRIRDLVRF